MFYAGFALAAFMMMASMTVGHFGWAGAWLLLLWLNASSVAESVQTREAIARIPDELKVKLLRAITETQK